MKYLLFLTALLLVSIVIAQGFTAKSTKNKQKTASVNGVGTIPYDILESKNGYEIRQYPDLTVAITTLNSNSYSKNSSVGFRKIASYIFGGNKANEQIAMTSPVQMDMGIKPTMSFFMPGNADTSDLPAPNRQDVVLKVQPAKIVAAIEFSGWASDKVLKDQFNILKSKLSKDSMEFEETYSFLGYNPPYKIINRKNEVIIPIKNYKKL